MGNGPAKEEKWVESDARGYDGKNSTYKIGLHRFPILSEQPRTATTLSGKKKAGQPSCLAWDACGYVNPIEDAYVASWHFASRKKI